MQIVVFCRPVRCRASIVSRVAPGRWPGL